MKGLVILAAVALCGAPALAQTTSSSMNRMVQPKCSASNPTVWVNTRSKVYYLRGSSYYGKTTHGRYLCRSAANAMGDHQAGMGTMHSTAPMSHPMMAPKTNPGTGSATAAPRMPPAESNSPMPAPENSSPATPPSGGSVPPTQL